MVLFADVVDFTAFCDENPPEAAVSRLQGLINGFEEIALSEGLEKIKTIGDAIMATANLLQPTDQPLVSAARGARRMVEAAPHLAQGWQVRIGMHVGPVVAGVIGQQQHLFALWGGTVNIAARITDLAGPSNVCISAAVRQGLRAQTTPLGNVAVKGKGQLEVFSLGGLR